MLNIKPTLLITEKQIQKRIQELSKKLNTQYQNKHVIAIGILKGSFVFYSDLIRLLSFQISCDFCTTSSYGTNKQPSSEIKLIMDTHLDISKKHVLLIEDIVDRGLTFKFLISHFKNRNPLSITTVSLLAKKQKNCPIDHIGFKIDNTAFIVGYGMDYQERFRNLPYLAELNNLN